MLIGTDSGIPMKFHSQSTWNELDVWVNVMGVDPLDAIKSATYWPSFFMGVDNKVGTISVGKQADIIAVKGNVLKYIFTTKCKFCNEKRRSSKKKNLIFYYMLNNFL